MLACPSVDWPSDAGSGKPPAANANSARKFVGLLCAQSLKAQGRLSLDKVLDLKEQVRPFCTLPAYSYYRLLNRAH